MIGAAMISGSDAHGIVVWVAGSVIAAAIIAASVWVVRRPLRWVARTLIVHPAAAFFRREVGEEVDARLAPVVHQVAGIAEAIRPTNGDRRSISDRLDTVKYTGIKTELRVGTLEKHLNDRFKVTDDIAAAVGAVHDEQVQVRADLES